MLGKASEKEELSMSEANTVRDLWAAGDYAAWGDLFADVGRELVEDVGVDGLDVLDVATGTGNTAIAAARAGGRVTGLDITPELLIIARERAATHGLTVAWVEGDMNTLDFPDASFDRVLSTFGAMLATDPAVVAAELVRVCRPGGLIALTAWRAHAAFSKMGAIVGSFFPPPPQPQLHDPLQWADAEQVKGFFGNLPVAVATAERSVEVRWPSLGNATQMIATTCGPLRSAVAALEDDGRWDQARTLLADMLTDEGGATDDGITVEMPYLLTMARSAT